MLRSVRPVARILVVDDEVEIADAVAARLGSEGHTTVLAATALQALACIECLPPDLVVLDLTLPDLDGIEVCRRIQRSTAIPVLMLTARGDEADVVLGLEVGADDYLTKPFSQRELMARVRAILRRIERERAAESDGPVTVADLAVDVARRTVTRQGRTLQLTPTEFDLLAFLTARPGVVFSRLALLADVWGYRDGSGARTVDSHVRSLRRKAGNDVVRTVHGVGYALGLSS
jgi:DNA-binding response OmpR family regulator